MSLFAKDQAYMLARLSASREPSLGQLRRIHGYSIVTVFWHFILHPLRN
jgi:hypothetical protein